MFWSSDERRSIASGCVFVWQERGPNAEATGLGIERWTDGIRWGPSRVRDEFLFYHEKDPAPVEDITSDSEGSAHSPGGPSRRILRNNLIKQTYSVFVETPSGRRKWHLIAYFTQESLDFLRSIDDIPQLASLTVPPGMYKSARSAKGRPRDTQGYDSQMLYNSHAQPSQYIPYTTGGGGPVDNPTFTPKLQTPAWSTTPAFPQSQQNSSLKQPVKVCDVLAPLAYLQNIPPSRRHPLDEKALMSFSPGFH